jgi:hypothetical protein
MFSPLVLAILIIGAAFAQSSISLDQNNWSVISEGEVPLTSNGTSLFFSFPVDSVDHSTINYLRTRYQLAPLTGAKSLTAKFNIATTGNPVFNYKFEPANTCPSPAKARLYFARTGWETGGEFYRWWANSIAYRLAAGSASLIVPLDPSQWSSVYGKFGNADASTLTGFAAAEQNVGEIGFTFGGGCFFGHGVNVTGGAAEFILTDYSILRLD